MLLYFSVCRLSDLSELVKYCPHPVSVDRFYTEPRNITSLAERRLSGSAHQLSIPVGGAAVTARVVAWKMGREEINKKCSWKYFSRIILNVSGIFLLFSNIVIQYKNLSFNPSLLFISRINRTVCYITWVWALLLHVTNIAGHASD